MEGGSQAQDHGRATYAKIRYSVSSIFATGFGLNKEILHEAICNNEFSGNNVVTILRQLKTYSEHCYKIQNRGCESPRATNHESRLYYAILSTLYLYTSLAERKGQYMYFKCWITCKRDAQWRWAAKKLQDCFIDTLYGNIA